MDKANTLNSLHRLTPVDGLRAVAVLGVLWIHVWGFCGTPEIILYRIGRIPLDLNRALAFVGEGVSLFFVISGFCMYLMYARKQTRLDWAAFRNFLQRRWLRIAPAFYAAVLAYTIYFWLGYSSFSWRALISHLLFIHTLIPEGNSLARPFWSLATEWHFYLALPLLIWATVRYGFWRVLGAAAAGSLAFGLWLEYVTYPHMPMELYALLPKKLAEFCCGMAVAKFYDEKRAVPVWLAGVRGFLLALAFLYVARMLKVSEVLHFLGRFGFVGKALSDPLFTLGCAGLMWNVMTSRTIFQTCLNHWTMQAVGRWSYSIYLWHWALSMAISQWLTARWGAFFTTQLVAFAATLAFIIPLGALSYRWLEAPYFRWRQTPATQSVANTQSLEKAG